MRCSCVIVNYTEPVRSAALARSLVRYDEVARVIVVDNCSPDDSWERLQELAGEPGIVLVKSERNGGYGAGNNLGFRYCLEHPLDEELQLVAVVNPDAMIDGEALAECMRCFEEHPQAIVAAPIEYSTEGERYEKTAWVAPSAGVYILQFLAILGRIRRIAHYDLDSLRERFARVDCVSGALLMLDAQKFAELGLYDEEVFLFCEETGLGVRSKGVYETYLCTQARYTHEFSTSVRTSLPNFRKRTWILCRSRMRVLEADYRLKGPKLAVARLCYGISLLEAWPLAWAYNVYCWRREKTQG